MKLTKDMIGSTVYMVNPNYLYFHRAGPSPISYEGVLEDIFENGNGEVVKCMINTTFGTSTEDTTFYSPEDIFPTEELAEIHTCCLALNLFQKYKMAVPKDDDLFEFYDFSLMEEKMKPIMETFYRLEQKYPEIVIKLGTFSLYNDNEKILGQV